MAPALDSQQGLAQEQHGSDHERPALKKGFGSMLLMIVFVAVTALVAVALLSGSAGKAPDAETALSSSVARATVLAPAATIATTAELPPIPAPATPLAAPLQPVPATPPAASGVGLWSFLKPAPDITAGAQRPHGDRGTCMNCHHILAPTLTPVPSPTAPAATVPSKVLSAAVETTSPAATAADPIAPLPAPAPTATTAVPAPTASLAPLTSPTQPAALTMPLAQAVDPTAAGSPMQSLRWAGLQVMPLGPRVATALSAPAGSGVLVVAVNLQAASCGIAAGDIVTNVENQPTPDLSSFQRTAEVVRFQPRATVQVLRRGMPLNFELQSGSASLGGCQLVQNGGL